MQSATTAILRKSTTGLDYSLKVILMDASMHNNYEIELPTDKPPFVPIEDCSLII